MKHPLRLWERVFIVLGKRFFPGQMNSWGRSDQRVGIDPL